MTIAISPLASHHERFVCSAFCNERKLAKDAGLFDLSDPKQRQAWWDASWSAFWSILSRATVRTFVAHSDLDADAYRGFLSVDTSGRIPLVYYVYVAGPYRRTGHAHAMFAAAGVDPKRPFAFACRNAVVDSLTSPRGETPPKYQLAKYAPVWARWGKEKAND